jgi:DNA-binding MurR/RpiR family transcriptional regulator
LLEENFHMPAGNCRSPNGTSDSATGILSRIHHTYDELSQTERRIADWILANASDATTLSISDIAERCGVGEATIFRFCRQLAGVSFREFRVMLAQEIVAKPLGYEWDDPHADVDIADDVGTVAQKVTRANIESLYEMWDNLDCAAVEDAVAALSQARQIIIYGEGSSGVIGRDAEYRLLRVGLPVQYHTSHMAFVVSALLTPQDATIAISHSGRTLEVVEAQKLAKGAGAATIALTSFPSSPLAEASDIKLIVEASRRLFGAESIPWRIVQLTMIDILCVRLWQHFGKEFCRERASQIDTALKGRRIP